MRKGAGRREPDVSARDSVGLDQAIRHAGYEVRWNERAQCAEIKGDVWIAHLDATEPNWERLTDRREALLRERVGTHHRAR